MLALKKTSNVFVKCCGYREVETFHHIDWATTQEQFVAPLLVAYGTDPDLDFVLVDPVDPAVEVGGDNYVVKGQAPKVSGYGYEDKDSSYLGTWSNTLPQSLQRLSSALSPLLATATSFVSTEVRVAPGGAGYPVDLDHPCRAPATCGDVVQHQEHHKRFSSRSTATTYRTTVFKCLTLRCRSRWLVWLDDRAQGRSEIS